MHDPVTLIIEDRERARSQADPYADLCFLATASRHGEPSVRTLVLRDICGREFGVLFNATSPKWQDLQQTGHYELLLYWSTTRRQYRIRGGLRSMPAAVVQASWARQPYGSKLLDWCYTESHAQSTAIASREDFMAQIESLRTRFPSNEAIPMPSSATGVYLIAERVEVLAASPEDRLHDRRVYIGDENGWVEQVLIP